MTLRKGKWTTEEVAYTSTLIDQYQTGFLNLPDNLSLRSYIAIKLNCDSTRVAKKIPGLSNLRKSLRPTVQPSASEKEQAMSVLQYLESRFLKSINVPTNYRTVFSSATTVTSSSGGSLASACNDDSDTPEFTFASSLSFVQKQRYHDEKYRRANDAPVVSNPLSSMVEENTSFPFKIEEDNIRAEKGCNKSLSPYNQRNCSRIQRVQMFEKPSDYRPPDRVTSVRNTEKTLHRSPRQVRQISLENSCFDNVGYKSDGYKRELESVDQTCNSHNKTTVVESQIRDHSQQCLTHGRNSDIQQYKKDEPFEGDKKVYVDIAESIASKLREVYIQHVVPTRVYEMSRKRKIAEQGEGQTPSPLCQPSLLRPQTTITTTQCDSKSSVIGKPVQTSHDKVVSSGEKPKRNAAAFRRHRVPTNYDHDSLESIAAGLRVLRKNYDVSIQNLKAESKTDIEESKTCQSDPIKDNCHDYKLQCLASIAALAGASKSRVYCYRTAIDP